MTARQSRHASRKTAYIQDFTRVRHYAQATDRKTFQNPLAHRIRHASFATHQKVDRMKSPKRIEGDGEKFEIFC